MPPLSGPLSSSPNPGPAPTGPAGMAAPAEGPFRCPVDGCGKSYFSNDALAKHTLRLHQAPEYRCDVPGCGKAFAWPSELAVHQKAHGNERPYPCPHPGCGLAFKTWGGLRDHVRVIHEKIKNYTCPIPGCSLAFRTPANLKRHLEAHGDAVAALPPEVLAAALQSRRALSASVNLKRKTPPAAEASAQPPVRRARLEGLTSVRSKISPGTHRAASLSPGVGVDGNANLTPRPASPVTLTNSFSLGAECRRLQSASLAAPSSRMALAQSQALALFLMTGKHHNLPGPLGLSPWSLEGACRPDDPTSLGLLLTPRPTQAETALDQALIAATDAECLASPPAHLALAQLQDFLLERLADPASALLVGLIYLNDRDTAASSSPAPGHPVVLYAHCRPGGAPVIQFLEVAGAWHLHADLRTTNCYLGRFGGAGSAPRVTAVILYRRPLA